jgi:hypothetical protein
VERFDAADCAKFRDAAYFGTGESLRAIQSLPIASSEVGSSWQLILSDEFIMEVRKAAND